LICAALRRTARSWGPGRFTNLLSEATGDTELTEAIMSMLDELNAGKTEGA
jgi:hypothetical protein